MRALAVQSNVDVLRNPARNLEMTWPLIRKVEKTLSYQAGHLVAHKFTAYAFNAKALAYLAVSPPRRRFVLCVRDTRKALVSWHNMHRQIAQRAAPLDHFAWRERDFYSQCSLAEYYEAFARDRLAYDVYFQRVVQTVKPGRLLVVSQERMAQDTDALAAACAGFGHGTWPMADGATAVKSESTAHKGYADKAVIDLSEQVDAELTAVNSRLSAAVAASGVYTYW